jgi:hypothetical protein
MNPGNYPVPNASSVDWPQSQFAPPFLPAGSASFSPYRYNNFDQAQVLYAGPDDSEFVSVAPKASLAKWAMIAVGVGLAVHMLRSMSADAAY